MGIINTKDLVKDFTIVASAGVILLLRAKKKKPKDFLSQQFPGGLKYMVSALF